MEVTYFTCTLGQAIDHQEGKPYNTINEFIAHKALQEPSRPAVGFYKPGGNPSAPWTLSVLSFKDVHRGVEAVADALSRELDAARTREAVALLSPSSSGFLFTWLGLIRLGHPVLLVAPQCSSLAIAQLCRSCQVRTLLHDKMYEDLAGRATSESSTLGDASLNTRLLPFAREDILQVIKRTPPSGRRLREVSVEEGDIAYLHHTSGTSAGIPKPIPQTHRAAVGVLPILNGSDEATFTSTPLYHGGIADLFRAWTSNALIWLFPGKELPISARNIGKCLDLSETYASKTALPQIKYFSSVPYVLQMMAEDKEGLRLLQKMELAGVGGAALPEGVGERLVKNDVKLISRFGSAECGFLMSSHRDYSKDDAWQYLRAPPEGEHLGFEPRDDGLFELVIQQGWPHMAKRNRENDSYATADLFSPHPTIPSAWRYHSRADSQLTLTSGKKFDPAPLEDAIRASSPLIEEAVIFGDRRMHPGVLLFRSAHAATLSDRNLLDQLFPLIDRLNRESQSHARIPRTMIMPMPQLDRALEKSSKGTILRTKVEERFAERIASAYEANDQEEHLEIPDSEIPRAIHDIVTNIVGEHCHEPLTDDTDLFAYGVDSVASIQIRRGLARLVPIALPITVVEDTGTFKGLVDLVLRARNGDQDEGRENNQERQREDDMRSLMLNLVQKYRVFDEEDYARAAYPSSSSQPSPSVQRTSSQGKSAGIRVLLTGATGSLGAHILSQLIVDARVSRIHLLVRGATPHTARTRVLKALSSRSLSSPSPPAIAAAAVGAAGAAGASFDSKVSIWEQCKFSDPRLGLSETEYAHLAGDVDVILHLAWSVNFLLPLRSFAATHLAGLRNLLNLALAAPTSSVRFVFCSSVAAVSNYHYHDASRQSGSSCSSPTSSAAFCCSCPSIPERVILNPSVSGPTGYARAKWVGEQICRVADAETRLRGRISIARVGQLSGATDTGVWSASEAYPLMLSSALATGVLPDLKGEVLTWLPVDRAAAAFVEDALTSPRAQDDVGDTGGPAVHHVLNPDTSVQWSDLLTWLTRREPSLHGVSVDEWLSRLSALQEVEATKAHPALRLLGFWQNIYDSSRPQLCEVTQESASTSEVQPLSSQPRDNFDIRQQQRHPQSSPPPQPTYIMDKTCERMPSLDPESSSGISEEYILKLWTWIKTNV